MAGLLGIPYDFADGMAEPRPIVVRRRPYQFDGKLRIADAEFQFATGGYGRGSIPYGDYMVTPEEVGSWGRRHGALGIAGDEIWDSQLGIKREGIELHAARHHMASAGCVAVEQWGRAKKAILTMIEKNGNAFLHIWPGLFSVTPEKSVGRAIVVINEKSHGDERAAHHERHHYARHHYRHYARA